MTTPKKPHPHAVSDLRARVVRGPKDGKWYWRIWRTRNAIEETVQTGWWHEAEIERVLAKLVVHGVDSPRGNGDITTVRDLLECWMATQAKAKLSPHTVHARRAAARHFARVVGNVELERLDDDAVQDYANTRLEEPVCVRRKKRLADGTLAPDDWEDVETGRTTAPGSIRLELQVLRFAWTWGRRKGVVPLRDAPKARVRWTGYVRNRYDPSLEEVVKVLRELPPWARMSLFLYKGTGARLDEIASLRCEAVNVASTEITVSGKTGARIVKVDEALMRAVVQYGLGPSDARLLRCAYSTSRSIYEVLRTACARAGVPRFAPGALRRVAVNAVYEVATDPSVAGYAIGHSPVVAMRHYRTVQKSRAAELLQKAGLTNLPGVEGISFRDAAASDASPSVVAASAGVRVARKRRHNARHKAKPATENPPEDYLTRYPPISLLKIHATTSPISNPAAM